MDLSMIAIGDRIKSRRKELKLSQLDIYEKCNISSGALSKIENGITTPSIIAFYKLAQALECDMNWLATGSSSNLQNQNDIYSRNERQLLDYFELMSETDQYDLLLIAEMKAGKIKRKTDARSSISPSNSTVETA